MKVSERTQMPPQPVKEQVAQKLQGQEAAQQMMQKVQERSQAVNAQPKAPSPDHLGQNVDLKG